MKNDRIVINVSGLRFETYAETLSNFPDTLLGDPQKRKKYYDNVKDEYFFDRSRSCFDNILYYYQSGGVLNIPENVHSDIFQDELKFFCLESDHNQLNCEPKSLTPRNSVKINLWLIFENPVSSIYAEILALFSILVVLLSITVFCVETFPQFDYSATNMNQMNNQRIFFYIESFCNVWFSLEIIIRFVLSPEKCKFVRNYLNIIDLISIFPYYISILTLLVGQSEQNTIDILRVMRLIRVFRVFKLSRHSQGLKILGKTILASFDELVMFFMFLMISVIFFSSTIYFLEINSPNPPFTSIPDAFWWSLITLTTVGYGDVYPLTVPGKFLTFFCVLAGILTITLPVPVIISKFSHFYNKEKLFSKN